MLNTCLHVRLYRSPRLHGGQLHPGAQHNPASKDLLAMISKGAGSAGGGAAGDFAKAFLIACCVVLHCRRSFGVASSANHPFAAIKEQQNSLLLHT